MGKKGLSAEWILAELLDGQIAYLLTECVRQRKKNGAPVPNPLDPPIELDIE